LRWGLKQSCNLCQELFKGMSHASCTHGNRNDFWHLVVRNQIVNLTSDLSFGHNLCFKCPNGSCQPILNMYVPRAFQWYKELFNAMGFDPYNRFLKIRESTEPPIPKVGTHLGVWGFIPSHSLALLGAWNVILGPSHLAHTFASLCLGCEPKARVVTKMDFINFHFHFKF